MARHARSILIALLLAGAALVLGLAGSTLRTGWIDPLNWLAPCLAAALLLARWRAGDARAGDVRVWLLVVLPVTALIVIAAVHVPWLGSALLAAGVALALLIVRLTVASAPAVRFATLGALLVASYFAPSLSAALRGDGAGKGERPIVGVMTAMPLHGAALGAAQGLAPMESVGLRSPLWQVLDARLQLRPLDALDARSLQPLPIVLIAQPRLLAPEELVALDVWVRRGGRAVVLADPLLHWPDPRPLGHPARAPLTSLLDPLLGHWGLRLEAAEIGAGDESVDRQQLGTGGLLQLRGASRFSRTGSAGQCTLVEQGLLADCRLGAGRALLVADADWTNDLLWTLSPGQPRDRRAWTSDAPDQLIAWLREEPLRVGSLGAWLADAHRLRLAIRVSLLMLVMLVIGDALVARRPSVPHETSETDNDQIWNKTDTKLDTT